MDIVAHRKIFYIISGLLVGASIVSLVFFGLKLGIDFTGGSILEVEFSKDRPDLEAVRERVESLGLGEVRVQATGERGVILRFKHVDEPTHQVMLASLGQPGVAGNTAVMELRFDTVGPTIGRELRQKSIVAIALVIILILGYIAWAFRRVSEPIKSWQYGLITIAALMHDLAIPVGLFSVLGAFGGYEADTLFVTALLTILGFSVHDTIVVFDRIRENLKKSKTPVRPHGLWATGEFEAIVNASVNETFSRSVNTSVTVLLALVAIYFFGGEATRAFALTMAVGVIVGTYSSIFIASPLAVTWHQWKNSK